MRSSPLVRMSRSGSGSPAVINDPARRAGIIGVIGTGNRNFGATYALSGRIIAQKCNVPLLYSFELAGTDTDIARVRAGLEKLGRHQCSTAA